MEEGITLPDIESLMAQNPLAGEQLRRIIAERHRVELQAELDALKAKSNAVGTEAVVEATAS